MLALRLPAVPTGTELTAILVVACFSAGLNVYATVGMLGILARTGALTLAPALHTVESTPVIAICTVLFAIGFVGDKIPVFDLLWNALHTFVRIPVAALLAYGATAQLPPWEQSLATLAGALIALAAHGGKIAARTAVTHSPEPFSNIMLSLGEDGAVVFLTWFATRHPYVSAGIVMVALVFIVLMTRFVIRALRRMFGDTRRTIDVHPAA